MFSTLMLTRNQNQIELFGETIEILMLDGYIETVSIDDFNFSLTSFTMLKIGIEGTSPSKTIYM